MANLMEKTTGKERNFRIRLDHYKAWDPVTSLKWWLAAIALLLGIVAVAWAFGGPGGKQLMSHGPLSNSHAAWEADCQVCHTPGVPLRADAVSFSSHAENAELRCQSCHWVSDHHTQTHKSDQSCALCHREHQGKMFNISHVTDAACTNCHADMASVENVSSNPPGEVTGFAKTHPEFNLPTSDPSTLGFSHSRHMRLGLKTSKDSKENEAITYEYIAEDMRSNYLPTDAAPSDLVQLDCSSCHQMQSTTGIAAAGRGTFFADQFRKPLPSLPSAQSVGGRGRQLAAARPERQRNPIAAERKSNRQVGRLRRASGAGKHQDSRPFANLAGRVGGGG